MGIASFIVGLSFLILSPFLHIYLILPSLLSLILGIIDTILKVKNRQSRTLAVAGIILSTLSLGICILISFNIYNYDSESISNKIVTGNIEDIISSTNKCNLGDSAILDDIKITFKNIDYDYKNYNENAFIPNNYVVLKADFDFENIGDSSTYITYYDFDCFVDGFSCNTFYDTDDYYFNRSLESGEKYSASVYFEIPKNYESIELEYDSNSYLDGKIIFNLENKDK